MNFSVIGDPIEHSLSPLIHGAVIEKLGLPHSYDAHRVAPEGLAAFVDRARTEALGGFNVTMPHKVTIMSLLDKISDSSKTYRSVNTVVNRGGVLTGYSTDSEGFARSLAYEGISFIGKNVLILGAGGVVGPLAILLAGGATSVTILNIFPEMAQEICGIAERTIGKSNLFWGHFNEAAACAGNADLLINATPLGMKGFAHGYENFEFLDRLPKTAAVCDVIYSPPKTRLLQESEKRGHKIMNGLGMLIFQALVGDKMYFDVDFDMDEMYEFVAEKVKTRIG